MKQKLTFLIIILFAGIVAKADSPLTSTSFHTAYLDIKIVKYAYESDGLLDKKMCKFLNKKRAPIDQKVALINALSWKFEGKNNFPIYLDYIKSKNKRINNSNYMSKCSAEQLICLAYLKALDDYFEVSEALALAKKAIEKNKKSYTIHIIHGLIKGQFEFDNDFSNVYLATNNVRQNENLKKDMRQDAIKIIFDYMDLYKDN